MSRKDSENSSPKGQDNNTQIRIDENKDLEKDST